MILELDLLSVNTANAGACDWTGNRNTDDFHRKVANDPGCREILEEALDEVGADESSCACHEDGLAFAEVYVVVEHCVFWEKDIRFASACPIDKQQKRLGEIFS